MSSAVLLAEPEEATRSFLERHLAQDGFEVVGVPDGEALELIERMCPDLVLIGDPEGLELCRRLRERDREVPVILLGAQESDPVDRVRAFDRGCDDYLDRPFHYDELVARIRAVLRRVAPPESERMVAGDDRDRPTDEARDRGRAPRPPADEGVRAAAEAGERSRDASSRRTSSCVTSGASAQPAGRARSTRTPRDCGAASAVTTYATCGASATACSATERAERAPWQPAPPRLSSQADSSGSPVSSSVFRPLST